MRLLSYNTRGSLGMDGRRSTARIVSAVRSLSPDLICFQEIHRGLVWSGREDQPLTLSTLLFRPFYFQANLRFGRGGFGIGISARGDRVDIRQHLLPSVREQRGALEIRLRHTGGLMQVTAVCTHWGLDAGERMQQAEALAGIVRAARAPVVVCGDLNEPPDGPAVRLLREQTGLVDADAQANRPTYPADCPLRRIDYILFSPDLVCRHVEVGTTQASDHLPVLADLERRNTAMG